MTTTTTGTGLDAHGITPRGRVIHNPTTAQLYTHALASGAGRLAHGGALVVDTGRFTGRSPQDKFVVDEPGSRDRIWWGEINHPLGEPHFDGLRTKVVAHLADQDVLYVVDHHAGANPDHRVGVRVVTASPYHALFAKTMFIVPSARELEQFSVDALVLHAPEVEAVPEDDGTRTGTFVVLHPSRSEVLIGGTFYGGEIKKGIFSLMNDRLPLAGVLSMHCSANVGDDGRVAVFFGLSGTGKTTLSADPARALIGDDEHGWSSSGVFNIEGGCYAKVIRLSAEAEPEIWKTTRIFGTILENVAVDEAGVIDLDNDSKTENTRAAYKLERIANALPTKRAGHPSSVVFLAADAFAVLPPIARLSREQAMYWFLTGFTAKLAGIRTFGFALNPTDAGLLIRGTTLLNGKATGLPEPFTPDLLDRVPGNSWFAATFGNLDATIKQTADQALSTNEDAQKQVSQVEALLGIKVDDLYALLSGDQAVFAGPGAPVSAGLILHPDDASKAATTLRSLTKQ